MKIEAKILAHSISPQGIELLTYELQYPRLILAELNTHHMLTPNSASSRAIPTKKLIDMVRNYPAKPSRFGENKPGMQDKGEEYDALIEEVFHKNEYWSCAASVAATFAQGFADAGYSKQVCNRLIEPFQWMKTVITGTEWNNFFWLRTDEDADPTFQELAKIMEKAKKESIPEKLCPGIWHTPYVEHKYNENGEFEYYYVLDENGKHVILSTQEAKEISASCCAQVSYRTLNTRKEKALSIYDKLVNGQKVHASPFTHQATPMDETMDLYSDGVTHMDKNHNLWSGNLKGYIQHRQLIKGNYYEG
jgi:hypothetical protein